MHPAMDTPYCVLYHLELTEAQMTRKRCVEKNCPHLVHVKEVITYAES